MHKLFFGSLFFIAITECGLLLLLHSKLKKENFNLFIFIISIIGWTLFVAISIALQNIFSTYFVYFFATVGITALSCYLYHFQDKHISSEVYVKWYLPSVIMSCLFMLPNFIYKIEYFDTFSAGTVPGKGYFLFLLYLAAYFSIGWIKLFVTYQQQLSAINKKQIKYILIGSVLFVLIATITNAILPIFYITFLTGIGPLMALFFIVAILYIVARYHFLDIKLILERGLIEPLSLVLITSSALLLSFGINSWHNRWNYLRSEIYKIEYFRVFFGKA